jgi:hypothetical protein
MKISRYRAGLKRFIPFRQCVASEFAIVLAFECVAWAGNRRGRIKLEKAQEEDHFSLEQVTARSTKRAGILIAMPSGFRLSSGSSSSSSSFTLNLKNSDTRM